MTIVQAIILSIVEGVTEFLPVSSTGHLILVSTWLRIPQTDFVSSFEIFIQLGAILAVLTLYSRSLIRTRKNLLNAVAAFVPTAVIGFILYGYIKRHLLNNPWVVVASLIIGGMGLIAVELYLRKKEAKGTGLSGLTVQNSMCIGIFQALSVIPGVSRAAATIIGGQLLGLERSAAVEFSFLLAVPTMLAATGLDAIKSHIFAFSAGELQLMGLGFIVSFVTALLIVKFFFAYIQKHTFVTFGVYRIVAAVLFMLTVPR